MPKRHRFKTLHRVSFLNTMNSSNIFGKMIQIVDGWKVATIKPKSNIIIRRNKQNTWSDTVAAIVITQYDHHVFSPSG
jgi:hypothetical protein